MNTRPFYYCPILREMFCMPFSSEALLLINFLCTICGRPRKLWLRACFRAWIEFTLPRRSPHGGDIRRPPGVETRHLRCVMPATRQVLLIRCAMQNRSRTQCRGMVYKDSALATIAFNSCKRQDNWAMEGRQMCLPYSSCRIHAA